MEKTLWVTAEHRPKGSTGEYFKYWSGLMEEETLETAIERVKRGNPTQEFRNFKITEE